MASPKQEVLLVKITEANNLVLSIIFGSMAGMQ